MNQFFQFEQDFVASLHCIPMLVRMKLDTCGIKLKLEQWNKFELADRQQLIDQPCNSLAEANDYKQFLTALIAQRTGQSAKALAVDPHPAWENANIVPEAVQTKAASVDQLIQPAQWANLTPIQRFALIKLSRSSHENSNFLPAMQEFGLTSQT